MTDEENETREIITVIRDALSRTIEMDQACGKTRERALAITKLQEAHMWLCEDLETTVIRKPSRG